jgi:hypothetical protein
MELFKQLVEVLPASGRQSDTLLERRRGSNGSPEVNFFIKRGTLSIKALLFIIVIFNIIPTI